MFCCNPGDLSLPLLHSARLLGIHAVVQIVSCTELYIVTPNPFNAAVPFQGENTWN